MQHSSHPAQTRPLMLHSRNKPKAATSSAAAVTRFRLMSGRNSLRVSRCQTNRNTLHFIECLSAEIDIQKKFLTLQLLKETGTTTETSHSQLCFCHKNVTCVAIKKKHHVRVRSIQAWKSDCAMFKFWLGHWKTEEQKLGIIILLPVACTQKGKSTGKPTEHRISET